MSKTAKLLRFLNPDKVEGAFIERPLSFDLPFDLRAFFAKGYEFNPGRRGVGGPALEEGRFVVEVPESDSANEGRGGGVSYNDGPACMRRWRCCNACFWCKALKTGRLISTRRSHLRRSACYVRCSKWVQPWGRLQIVLKDSSYLNFSKACALRIANKKRVFINLPQLRSYV